MANHVSALRKHRRDQKRRMINKINKTKMRNKVKTLRKLVAAGNIEEAKTMLPAVLSVIDKTVSKGTIHHKTGSRYKSRLSLMLP